MNHRHSRIRYTRFRPRSLRLWLLLHTVLLACCLGGFAQEAWAGTDGPDMPWNGPLTAVVTNLSGQTGHALVLLAIMISGIIWAFTRHEEGGKKIGQIAVGGSLVLGAATLMASFGFAGAVV
ncbi:MAG TPA: TrbC/VirB2 family protein [Gemmatimonadaceae bacterium]|jgi:type IV secretory pathway VirB2 component (pilin)|nr:TrbC/VirB2 family protein [Gemmatimonadaceae bacterium]